MGDGVFVPYRKKKRRFIMVFLCVFLVCNVIFIFLNSINFGQVVFIDGEENILYNLNIRVPNSLILKSRYWDSLEINNYEILSKISNLQHMMPRATASFPGDGVDQLEGTLFYNGGEQVDISFAGVLRLNNVAYYDKKLHEEYLEIKETLYYQFYNPTSLASLISKFHNVVLEYDDNIYQLNRNDNRDLSDVINSCIIVEEKHDAEMTVRNRTPHYTIKIYNLNSVSIARIDIYSDETAMVYNTHGGQEYLMCINGLLDTFCQQYIVSH